MAIIYVRKHVMTGIKKSEGENSELAENGIVVTEAMIEAGVALLDDWLCLNLREMYEEGHTGHSKDVIIQNIFRLY